MTAVPWATRPPLPSTLRRMLLPREGWLSLLYLAVMGVIVAASIDDGRWVTGNPGYTDFLVPMTLGGGVVGLLTALLGVSRWVAHLTTAVVAAIVLPVVVGTILPSGEGSPLDLFRATADSSRAAWYDLAVQKYALTSQIGHHLLALGILAWGTGHFAAYAVFGHHRPLDAFIVLGVVLLGSMALTRNDQLWYLVGFSIAGLLLLARHHAIEEGATWLRRRIGDPGTVRSLYQTGGTVFVLAAVLGSLTLTATASSAPLQGAWRGFEGWLIEFSQGVQRFLPIGGASRPIGSIAFGEQAGISGAWNPDNTPALRIALPRGERQKLYWRVWTYDLLSPRAYASSPTVGAGRAADEPLVAGLADDPGALFGRRQIEFQVEPLDHPSRFAVSPDVPVAIDRAGQLLLLGETGRLAAIDVGLNPGPYRITASIPLIGDDEDPNGQTAGNLLAANEDYPADIRARYLDPGMTLGPDALQLLEEVRDRSQGSDPYHMAVAMERHLRSDSFTYDNDVQAELAQCGNLNIVDCFAITRRGYCQYYATTMAVLLRAEGIPTRLATGFLPGERDSGTGVEIVRNSGAHLWVEVYFPGYGWVLFDPTGEVGGPGQPLPTGELRTALPSLPPPAGPVGEDDGAIDPRPSPRTSTGARAGGQSSPALFIVIAVLLAGAIVAAVIVAWRQGPRGEVSAEAAWRGIARLAARLGFAPRPTETVYEYASALGDVVPQARPELHTVARAKVEVSYGRRVMGDDRMRAIRDAQRHLRVALLRLAFRRRDRRRKRTG
jgi:transglutaminase-like putative cysteine protease